MNKQKEQCLVDIEALSYGLAEQSLHRMAEQHGTDDLYEVVVGEEGPVKQYTHYWGAQLNSLMIMYTDLIKTYSIEKTDEKV